VKLFSTGKWGMVTNHAETEIRGTAQTGDIIEGHVWLSAISGEPAATLEARFQWWKKGANGSKELLAISSMSTSWVEVHGHGAVEIAPLPEFMTDFFQKMIPPSSAEQDGQLTQLPPLDFGESLYQEPEGPVQQEALLAEQIFETSLEDANLVGNIYFSNYYKWQGRVIGRYLNSVMPESYRVPGQQGEFRCVSCKVNHIQEAMPFDRIGVRLYRAALHERGIRFQVDFYLMPEQGEPKKLAHGYYEALWYSQVQDGDWQPAQVPEELRQSSLPKN